jgi:hypothetical protein
MSAIPLTFCCQIRIWLHHAVRNIHCLAELLYLPLEVTPILSSHPPIPDLGHISRQALLEPRQPLRGPLVRVSLEIASIAMQMFLELSSVRTR